MRKKRIILSAFILCFGLTGIKAQEAVTTAGSVASGSGGSASYSLGQVVYQTHTGANGSVTEGMLQPYEVFTVTGVEEIKGINLNISAYPNPTAGSLTLSINGSRIPNLSFRLYNMQGKLLQNKKITGNKISIAMGTLVRAPYFIKVIQGKKEIKTFEIIKN